MTDLTRHAELEAALMALPGGIGKAIKYVKAAPPMEQVVRDVMEYADVLPEEIIELAKVALDILAGGDGNIYRP